MQDERSQIQNRAKAMKVIRARVHDFQSRQAQATQSQLRSETAGTGSRSDKVRTFNFPQDRVTDHRVGLTISGVDRVLSGVDLQTIVEALVADEKKQRLENFVASLV
jgi:peptide chain release factor 1